MTLTHLPLAGWYVDPTDANSERYWSGAEWSDERRARPVASPKKRWHPFRPPLAEVVEGLRSQDAVTRVKAAARLRRVDRDKPSAPRLEVEIACLSDPVPAVRYHALNAVALNVEDRKWLFGLLASDRAADARIRASVLADIARLTGPDSPLKSYEAMKAKALRDILFNEALKSANSAETLRSTLEAAAGANMVPVVFAKWGYDEDHKRTVPPFLWPDRCCVCGATHPLGNEVLPFSGEIRERLSETFVGVTTLKGTLTVPTCCFTGIHRVGPSNGGQYDPLPAPTFYSNGVGMQFPNPQFVAELLHDDTWSIL